MPRSTPHPVLEEGARWLGGVWCTALALLVLDAAYWAVARGSAGEAMSILVLTAPIALGTTTLLAVVAAIARWPGRPETPGSARAAALTAFLVYLVAQVIVLEPFARSSNALAYWGMAVGHALVAPTLLILAAWPRIAGHRGGPALLITGVLVLGAIDRLAYGGLYPRIHASLFLAQLLLGSVAARALLPRFDVTRGRGVALAIALLVASLGLSLPAASSLDDAPMVKAAVLRSSPAAGKLWTFADILTDRDMDGTGRLLGRDCQDDDPEIHPLACERGTVEDRNCNGSSERLELERSTPARPVARPPSILLLSADALRADIALGSADTPGLLAPLAARGLVFDRAYTPVATTSHALPAVLRGRYPALDDPHPGDIRQPLAAAGYRLAFGCTAAMLEAPHPAKEPLPLSACHAFGDVNATAELAAAAERVLISTEGAPALVWVHLPDPHEPYTRDDGSTLGPARERYAAAAARAVRAMERIVAAVPVDRPWIVVLFSDHGEALGEHDTVQHGSTLYDEQIHVPLVVLGPGVETGRVETPVSLLQLAPSLAELTGISAGPHHAPPLPGLGLTTETVPVFSVTRTRIDWDGRIQYRQVGVISGALKLVSTPRTGMMELYDLGADPLELNNVYDPADPSHAALSRDLAALENTLCLFPQDQGP